MKKAVLLIGIVLSTAGMVFSVDNTRAATIQKLSRSSEKPVRIENLPTGQMDEDAKSAGDGALVGVIGLRASGKTGTLYYYISFSGHKAVQITPGSISGFNDFASTDAASDGRVIYLIGFAINDQEKKSAPYLLEFSMDGRMTSANELVLFTRKSSESKFIPWKVGCFGGGYLLVNGMWNTRNANGRIMQESETGIFNDRGQMTALVSVKDDITFDPNLIVNGTRMMEPDEFHKLSQKEREERHFTKNGVADVSAAIQTSLVESTGDGRVLILRKEFVNDPVAFTVNPAGSTTWINIPSSPYELVTARINKGHLALLYSKQGDVSEIQTCLIVVLTLTGKVVAKYEYPVPGNGQNLVGYDGGNTFHMLTRAGDPKNPYPALVELTR